MKQGDEETRREIGAGYDLLAIGMTFALTLTGFALLGLWLDRKLGSTPWLTVVGTFVGMGLGGFWVFQRLMRRPPGDGR